MLKGNLGSTAKLSYASLAESKLVTPVRGKPTAIHSDQRIVGSGGNSACTSEDELGNNGNMQAKLGGDARLDNTILNMQKLKEIAR